jgi:hypothetical protein
MSFRKLQDRLRRRLLAQIGAGQLTGLGLADLTGFQQAHISNFLNRKRALSLEAMDRVLGAMRWSVVDLMEDAELQPRAERLSPPEDDYENVALVEDASGLAQPIVAAHLVREVLKFKRSFLRRLRPDAASARARWQRFVLVKADAREAMSMYPRMMPGATLLIDRHYNSLRPYRRNDRNMYAVRYAGGWTIKYVEVSGKTLVLRPENKEYPVSVVPLEEKESPSEYILGRVAHVAIET